MKKYFIKDKEVKLGDTISFEEVLSNKNWTTVSTHTFTFTEDYVDYLVENGYLRIEEEKLPTPQEMLEIVLDRVSKKLKMERTEVRDFINKVFTLNPSSAFSLLLKEIAVVLDKQYPDHISKVESIYIFNAASGKIQQVRNNLGCYKAFAAFRTKEDIDLALSTLEGWVKHIYGK